MPCVIKFYKTRISMTNDLTKGFLCLLFPINDIVIRVLCMRSVLKTNISIIKVYHFVRCDILSFENLSLYSTPFMSGLISIFEIQPTI